MTEGDKAFYRRRIREELKKAHAVENRQLRQLHLRWALMYQERIDGIPKNVTRELESRLRNGGYVVEDMAAPPERAPGMTIAKPSTSPATQVRRNLTSTVPDRLN